MEAIVFLALLAIFILVGSIAGLRAASRTAILQKELARLSSLLESLKEEVRRLKTAVPREEGIPDRQPPVAHREPAVTGAAIETPLTTAAVQGAEPTFALPTEAPAGARKPEVKPVPWKALRGKERWTKIEESAGKRWTTWAGAIALFLGAGFFVQYAFERLSPTTRVILGVIAGLAATATGERFIRRKMRALGQGVVGAGLAILYVSLYGAYGFYGLLPQPIAFGLMTVVTVGGIVLAVGHNAIAISFLAVLGGFITPVLLRTGKDPRDALFAYLLLLDLGVLSVAFFRRWRMLDVLAFAGTGAYFTGWYLTHYTSSALTPAMLWLGALYVVFLVQPFVYHLRLATPIVGERFFLAVSNAAGMFGWAHRLLYPEHKHVLGVVILGMSASYLALGALTRKRIKTDKRALLGLTALSVMFLTVAIPIHLDLRGVTVVWAVEAPVLLYLAYKYTYFPVRAGSLVPLALAAGRIFTIHWPLHEDAFTLIFNRDFGSAIFVAFAGGAYAYIHHLHRKASSQPDRTLKIVAGIGSAFLALIVMHVEVWQWLDYSGRGYFARWASAFVWMIGSAGFLAAGIKLRSLSARASGLVGLAVAGFLECWDFAEGIRPGYLLFLNGRFLAAVAVTAMVLSYGFVYLRSKELCRSDEKDLAIPFHASGLLLLAMAVSVETWQWLTFRQHDYIARCVLPFIWVAGAAGHLLSGVRLRSSLLRTSGLLAITVALIFGTVGYAHKVPGEYLLCFNWRFAGALAACLILFTHGFALRKLRGVCEAKETFICEALYGVGVFLVTLLVSVETVLWLHARDHYYLARCLLPVLWAAGAAAHTGAGIRLNSHRLRNLSVPTLSVAVALLARGYAFDTEGSYALYLNGRFLGGLFVVIMFFGHWLTARWFRRVHSQQELETARAVCSAGIALLFLLLSAENLLYFLTRIPDPERARWAAQMALSIVWGVYATAMLTIGFWRRIRPLRLSALGIFGLTGLKLVIVDMTKVREVYRIVSFVALGLLMIGASYLYHRVEKRMEAALRARAQGE